MATPCQKDVRSGIVASEIRVPTEDASFLRAVLEAIPSFVVRLDPEQRISYINHLRGGYTQEQVIGRRITEFVAPEDIESYEQAISEALRTGRVCSYMVKGSRTVRSDGAAYYQSQAIPVDHGDGRRAVCIVASDVSEQRARERELQQSDEKLRIAVEATGIGLWSWDMYTDRIEWDQRMVEMVGCDPMPMQEFIARFIHPEDRARMAREVVDAKAGRPQYPEYRVIRPDGEVRWFLPCGRVSVDEEGRATRIIGGMLDVTAQRRTDEHLRKSQRLDAIGCLTAGVTHNFNNMLAVIVPNLELVLRTASGNDAELLNDALYSARRATELVSQLMTFAGQRNAPAVEPCDLAPLLRNAVSICRRTFGGHVAIELAIDAPRAKVACVPAAIEQVVINLLINARDAVLSAERADPHIRVELIETSALTPQAPGRPAQPQVQLRVKDNGVGMCDEVKQRLFEPFFTTKEAGKGSGLGLATSYGILRDHGGRIAIESQRDVGTVVDVWLPLLQVEPASALARRPSRATGRGTILVADDEPAIRRTMSLLLTECGHEVHLASSGAGAVALLDAGVTPHLILLDRSMPGGPPRATVDAIRQRSASVPVVFFTGEDVTAEERACVQDVLYKPVGTEDLLQSVERWIGAAFVR